MLVSICYTYYTLKWQKVFNLYLAFCVTDLGMYPLQLGGKNAIFVQELNQILRNKLLIPSLNEADVVPLGKGDLLSSTLQLTVQLIENKCKWTFTIVQRGLMVGSLIWEIIS